MPSGKVWIGSDGGGVSIWDRQANSYAYLRHDPNNSNSIGSDAVLALLKGRKGNVWIGSWDGGLNMYNMETYKVERYSVGGDRIFDLAGCTTNCR